MYPRSLCRSKDLYHAIEICHSANLEWRILNAITTECWDRARNCAHSISSDTADVSNLPLYGLTLAVKDNFCTKGVKTSCGSNMLDSFVPPYSASIVDRLEKNGMLLIGKTNMDPFGMGSGGLDGIAGPVRNPWTWLSNLVDPPVTSDLGQDGSKGVSLLDPLPLPSSAQSWSDESDFRIAGGSSGGSAAAVAAGVVHGAVGSDTGGSVRNPAAYCGIVGLKPTYGLLSRHGLVPLVNGLDCPGLMARQVQQCVHMFNAAAGHDPLDSTSSRKSNRHLRVELAPQPSVKGLRVGIPKEYHSPHTSDEVLDMWAGVAEALSEAGAIIEEVSLPHTQYSISCYSVINCGEVASNMARFDGIEFGHRADNESSTEDLYAQTRHEAFSDVVRGRIFAGNYFLLRKNYEDYYMRAAKLRRLICSDFDDVFSGVDVLLTPVTIGEAPLYSQYSALDNRTQCSMQDVYTLPVNLAGLPAVSVPVKLSQNCMPLSIQLIGKHFDEKTILNTAHFLENEYKFADYYKNR